MPAAVLAGGLGTRLRSVTGDELPKALVPVLGRPFIDRKLEELATSGVEVVVLLVGHGGDQIASHVGDGSRFGVQVTCLADGDQLLGTGGAIARALPLLGTSFWVTYGDSLLTFDVEAAEAQFVERGLDVLMTVLRTEPPIQPNNARIDGDLVVEYGKSPRPAGATHVDYGMLACQGRVFDQRSATPFDLADLVADLAARGCIAAFEVDEPFHDIGTPAALDETERYLRSRAAST